LSFRCEKEEPKTTESDVWIMKSTDWLIDRVTIASSQPDSEVHRTIASNCSIILIRLSRYRSWDEDCYLTISTIPIINITRNINRTKTKCIHNSIDKISFDNSFCVDSYKQTWTFQYELLLRKTANNNLKKLEVNTKCKEDRICSSSIRYPHRPWQGDARKSMYTYGFYNISNFEFGRYASYYK